MANYLSNIYSNVPSDKIVVLASPEKESEEFDKKQNYKIYRRELLFKYLRPKWLRAFLPTLKIVRREKIEALHISHVLPLGYVAYLFLRAFKIPYIVYTHGLDILHPQNNQRKKYWIKKILQNAEQVIANSNFTAGEANKLGVQKERIQVINPCLDLSRYTTPSPKEADDLKNKLNLKNKKILLSVGRLIERKGFDMVIKSLPVALKNIPDLVYVIVGEGPDKKRLEDLIKKNNLESKVLFAGEVKHEDLYLYYNLAEIFIMPSRQLSNGDVEGFGIVYLEANLYGKPVIAGRSGGVPDAVEDGVSGLLVNPENVEEIRGAITKLFQNQELYNKLAKEGEKRVKEKFICRDFSVLFK